LQFYQVGHAKVALVVHLYLARRRVPAFPLPTYYDTAMTLPGIPWHRRTRSGIHGRRQAGAS